MGAVSVCSDGKCGDPGLGVWPVIGAQGIGIESASDTAIVAEQLEDERQRYWSQQLIEAAFEPNDVIGVRRERIVTFKNDSDGSGFGGAGYVEAVRDTRIRVRVAGNGKGAVCRAEDGDHVVVEVSRAIGFTDADTFFFDF
jgi:hypothetical protein